MHNLSLLDSQRSSNCKTHNNNCITTTNVQMQLTSSRESREQQKILLLSKNKMPDKLCFFYYYYFMSCAALVNRFSLFKEKKSCSLSVERKNISIIWFFSHQVSDLLESFRCLCYLTPIRPSQMCIKKSFGYAFFKIKCMQTEHLPAADFFLFSAPLIF